MQRKKYEFFTFWKQCYVDFCDYSIIIYALFCSIISSMRQLKIATQITNRDSDAVEKYLQDISKYGRISAEEEVRIA